MRPIKFRAWKPNICKMEYNPPLTYYCEKRGYLVGGLADDDRLVNPHFKERILMQFTGLHDKNGKEIYEGDICKISKEYSDVGLREFTFEVKWNKIGWNNLLIFECEVIGNIYENPELIE